MPFSEQVTLTHPELSDSPCTLLTQPLPDSINSTFSSTLKVCIRFHQRIFSEKPLKASHRFPELPPKACEAQKDLASAHFSSRFKLPVISQTLPAPGSHMLLHPPGCLPLLAWLSPPLRSQSVGHLLSPEKVLQLFTPIQKHIAYYVAEIPWRIYSTERNKGFVLMGFPVLQREKPD